MDSLNGYQLIYAGSSLVGFVSLLGAWFLYRRTSADMAAIEGTLVLEAKVVSHEMRQHKGSTLWANVYEAMLPDGSTHRQTSPNAKSHKVPVGTVQRCHYVPGPPRRLIEEGSLTMLPAIAVSLMAPLSMLVAGIVRVFIQP